MFTASRLIRTLAIATLSLCFLAPSARAQELVELKVDSTPRKYDQANPVQAAKQEFSLTEPGMVKLIFKSSMVYKDARGGFALEEVNLSSYTIGWGMFQQRIPDSAIPGQPYHFEQHWLVTRREKPLNLRATLVAPHYWDSPQLRGTGQQLAANQTLTITFIPFDTISKEPGPAPAVDISGKWYHGEANAILTFTPMGDGEYRIVEKGYDNIVGRAVVKGKKVFVDWMTTTATGAKQKKGVTVVEIQPDATHAKGWWVGEGGNGAVVWSAAPGTKAVPLTASTSNKDGAKP